MNDSMHRVGGGDRGDRLDVVLRGIQEIDVPAEVDAKMRARLDAFRGQLSADRSSVRPSTWSLLKQLLMAPQLRPAIAATLMVLLLVSVVLLVRTTTRSAYAVVADELRGAEAIAYVVQIADQTEVEVAFREPGQYLYRTSWGMEVLEDRVKGEKIILLHFLERYAIEPADENRNEPADLLGELRALPPKADRIMGERVFDGRTATGYAVDQEDAAIIVWIDNETERPLQLDISFEHEDVPVFTMHVRDIRIDDAVQDSIFDAAIPEHYERIAEGGEVPGIGAPRYSR